MRFNEAVELPKQCQNCPMLAQIAMLHDRLEDQKIGLLDHTVNDRSASIAEIAAHEDVSLAEAEEFYNLHEDELRAALLHDYDLLASQQDAEVGLTHKMALLCKEGVLRMRAVRNNTEVEVAVCMSDATRMTAAVVGFETARVVRRTRPGVPKN